MAGKAWVGVFAAGFVIEGMADVQKLGDHTTPTHTPRDHAHAHAHAHDHIDDHIHDHAPQIAYKNGLKDGSLGPDAPLWCDTGVW